MTYQSNIIPESGAALACWIDSGRTPNNSHLEDLTPLGMWIAQGRLPCHPQDEALTLMMHELPTEFLEDFVHDAPDGMLKNAAADIVALRAGAYGATLL